MGGVNDNTEGNPMDRRMAMKKAFAFPRYTSDFLPNRYMEIQPDNDDEDITFYQLLTGYLGRNNEVHPSRDFVLDKMVNLFMGKR